MDIEKILKEANIERRPNSSGEGWDFTLLNSDMERLIEAITKKGE